MLFLARTVDTGLSSVLEFHSYRVKDPETSQKMKLVIDPFGEFDNEMQQARR